MVKRVTREQFTERAARVHGTTYSYPEYEDMQTKVTMVCRVHGPFLQSPEKHCAGQGCRACGVERRTSASTRSTDEFLLSARRTHGERYDYDATKYVGAHRKVVIRCKEHGEFEQTPASHYSGNGCPSCGRCGWFKPSEDSLVYILFNADMVKVGVTSNTPEQRIANIKSDSGLVFTKHREYLVGLNALKVEQAVLRTLRHRYGRSTGDFNGASECFIGAELGYVTAEVEKEIFKYGEQSGA